MKSNQQILWGQINEKDFMQQVIDLARLHKWLVYHTHDSRRSAAGFPDLCLVRLSRVLFCELKTEKGQLTEAQHRWLSALASTGKVEEYCWFPHDRDKIEAVLR